MRVPSPLGVAALLAAAVLLPAVPSGAATLVEFSYGTGTGTNLADQVAANASVTPTNVYGNVGQLLVHSYVDLGEGDMAIRSQNADGNDAHQFIFTLSAAQGYRLKISDMEIHWSVSTGSGGSWSLSLWPDAEHAKALTMFSLAGQSSGDQLSSPDSWYWNTDTSWAQLVAQDDLSTLLMHFAASGTGLSAWVGRVTISGEVLPVSEPASLLLMSAGLAVVLLRRAARCKDHFGTPSGA